MRISSTLGTPLTSGWDVDMGCYIGAPPAPAAPASISVGASDNSVPVTVTSVQPGVSGATSCPGDWIWIAIAAAVIAGAFRRSR